MFKESCNDNGKLYSCITTIAWARLCKNPANNNKRILLKQSAFEFTKESKLYVIHSSHYLVVSLSCVGGWM